MPDFRIKAFAIVSAFSAMSVVVGPTYSSHPPVSAQAQTPHPPDRACGTIVSNFNKGNCTQITFRGEISAKRNFENTFGALKIRLNSQNASSGWTIEVVPTNWTSDTDPEYSWVVNPPYHFQNIRYLDTSYGIKAEDAVKNTPRNFNFVLDERQYERCSALVEQAYSSHPMSDHRSEEELVREGKKASDALDSLSIGKGRLKILDSRVDSSGGTDGLGAIEWLKFEVELHVPCNFAVANSDGISIDRSKCSGGRK
jgi:hypothetical protein